MSPGQAEGITDLFPALLHIYFLLYFPSGYRVPPGSLIFLFTTLRKCSMPLGPSACSPLHSTYLVQQQCVTVCQSGRQGSSNFPQATKAGSGGAAIELGAPGSELCIPSRTPQLGLQIAALPMQTPVGPGKNWILIQQV